MASDDEPRCCNRRFARAAPLKIVLSFPFSMAERPSGFTKWLIRLSKRIADGAPPRTVARRAISAARAEPLRIALLTGGPGAPGAQLPAVRVENC